MWREIHSICYLYNPVTRLGKWEVIATFESTTDGCMALVLGLKLVAEVAMVLGLADGLGA